MRHNLAALAPFHCLSHLFVVTAIKVFFSVFLLEAVFAFLLLIADLGAEMLVFSDNINIRRSEDKRAPITNYAM